MSLLVKVLVALVLVVPAGVLLVSSLADAEDGPAPRETIVIRDQPVVPSPTSPSGTGPVSDDVRPVAPEPGSVDEPDGNDEDGDDDGDD